MHLAQRLVHEGYPVTVIESDPDLLGKAAEELDARLICGNAMQLSSWREAHAENMELMIATTNDDSTNMLASLIADRFGIERKIVRARSIDLVDGSILSQDDLKKALDEVQKKVDLGITAVDGILKKKELEIMEV